MPLIDTHCHWDAAEFDPDRSYLIKQARLAGIRAWIVPGVEISQFPKIQHLAQHYPGMMYTLGIHPLYVEQANKEDLLCLTDSIKNALNDPHFVGIGEIGLDGFILEPDWEKQTYFFHHQLQLARRFDLPVILHIRRAQDRVLAGLRRFPIKAGIAHAFNGSFQQAEQFIKMKCKLGFGGAATFERALQIRRLWTEIPETAWVLETDAPDIPPAWRGRNRHEPSDLARIAEMLAALKNINLSTLAEINQNNISAVFPQIDRYCSDD